VNVDWLELLIGADAAKLRSHQIAEPFDHFEQNQRILVHSEGNPN
jgi:hypothetical protein